MIIEYKTDLEYEGRSIDAERLHSGWKIISDYILSYEGEIGYIYNQCDLLSAYAINYGDKTNIFVDSFNVILSPYIQRNFDDGVEENITKFLPKQVHEYINYLLPRYQKQLYNLSVANQTRESFRLLNSLFGDNYGLG